MAIAQGLTQNFSYPMNNGYFPQAGPYAAYSYGMGAPAEGFSPVSCPRQMALRQPCQRQMQMQQQSRHGSRTGTQPGKKARSNVCRHFLQGKCTWGESCRFVHTIPAEGLPQTDAPLLSEFETINHDHFPSSHTQTPFQASLRHHDASPMNQSDLISQPENSVGPMNGFNTPSDTPQKRERRYSHNPYQTSPSRDLEDPEALVNSALQSMTMPPVMNRSLTSRP